MSSKEKYEIGLMARGALDADVTRIAQHKPSTHACDSDSLRVTDSQTRLVIRVQGGEIRIQSRLELLPTLRLINSKAET